MKENRRESGQSIIIIAFIVLVILALLALVVDIGNAYAQRRVVQNAVDASSMACAVKLATQGALVDCGDDSGELCREHPVNDNQMYDIMLDFAEANGLQRTEVSGVYVRGDGTDGQAVGTLLSGEVPADIIGVRVEGDLTFATYFAHLLGVPELTVNAPSAAYVLAGPCTSDGLFPVSVNVNTFPDGQPVVGQQYIMMGGSPNGANDSFWWVYWDPHGTSLPVTGGPAKQQGPSNEALGENMALPVRSGEWHVDEWVPRSNGVQFTQEEQCIIGARIQGKRLNDTSVPGCKAHNPALLMEPEVTIPIHDGYDNNDGYQIAGFAKFHLTCYYHSNTKFLGDCSGCIAEGAPDKCIQGFFVDEVEEPFEDGCMDTGITAPSYRLPTLP